MCEDLLPICCLQFIATSITMSLSALKELENYGYKFKMNFVIHNVQQIQLFSKIKTDTGMYMQKPNRTLLTSIMTNAQFTLLTNGAADGFIF